MTYMERKVMHRTAKTPMQNERSVNTPPHVIGEPYAASVPYI